MSYSNSTTHYGFPLPLGTDLTVPMDYNQAMSDIDEHLFDAETDAETAATAAANAVETANDAAADVADLGTTVNAHAERLTSLEQHDIIQDNKIDGAETAIDNKFDSVGIADAYLNGLTYAVGDIVTYNGQRYKCITAVTAAEPFDSDKWQGEDIQTVIDTLNSELTVVLATANGTKTVAELITEASTAFKAITIPSDEVYEIVAIEVPYSATVSAYMLWHNPKHRTNDLSSVDFWASTIAAAATYTNIRAIFGSHFTNTHITDAGNTITEYGSEVPNSGKQVKAYFKVYKA